MALNRYRVTIMGADNSAGTVNPISVEIWVRGIEEQPRAIGEAVTYAGYVSNDSGLMIWGFKMPLVPIGLKADSMDGHDNEVYLDLVQGPLQKRFKFITAVVGLDEIGNDGTTQFWAQLLSTYTNKIPVKLMGIPTSYDYDDTKTVTLELEMRRPGL